MKTSQSPVNKIRDVEGVFFRKVFIVLCSLYFGGIGMSNFAKNENILDNENIAYLCHCLEKGGKKLADSAVGLSKNASNI